MKNILFIHNGSDLYGGSRSLLSIISIFSKKEQILSVVLPNKGPLITELNKYNVKVYVIKSLPVVAMNKFGRFKHIIKFLTDIYRSNRELIQIIKALKPDIIHANVSTLPTPVIAARLTGTKFIWHIREIYDRNEKFIFFIYQFYMTLLSNKIIANSDATRNQFSKLCRKKVVKLYNSLPKHKINTIRNKDISNFKNIHKINAKFYVGVIGRINFDRKGQDIFVYAAKKVKEEIGDVKYIIAGDSFDGKDYYKNRLIQIIDENNLENDVVLVGEVANINLLINFLDIVVIPSTRPESFGNVASEAMALCKPVIASNIGGVVEQVIHNKTGYIFKNKDIDTLANNIKLLLNDKKLREELGMNGKRTLNEKFNFKIFEKEIVNIFYNVYTNQ